MKGKMHTSDCQVFKIKEKMHENKRQVARNRSIYTPKYLKVNIIEVVFKPTKSTGQRGR